MFIQEDYFKNIFNTVRDAILILDENMRVLSANRSFFNIFKVDSANTIGSLLYDLGNGQWNIPNLRVLLEDILPKNDTVDDYEIEHRFESIGQKTMLLNACKIVAKKNEPPIILLAIKDITERREIEKGLENTRKELEVTKISEDAAREYSESIINTVREPLIVLDQDLRVVTASRSFYKVFQVTSKETVGQLIYDLGNKQWDIPKLRELLETIFPQKTTFDNYEVEHEFATIGRRIMLLNARQIKRVWGKERIILLAIEDITERKRMEHLQALWAEILGILNDPPDLDYAINRILTAIKLEMGFNAVGIRLQRGDDFPYIARDGFPNDFLLTENTLDVRNQAGGVCTDIDGNISLECTCNLVISGQTDPTNPLFTPKGSFWTNESFKLVDLPAARDAGLHPRNHYTHVGFHSVALIPLRAGKQIIGLLQLNDRRPNRFTLELISFFEDLGAIIGIAFSRKQAEDGMKKARELSDALNLELAVVNKELEAFSYSASHDLRAPLRQISGFMDLLQKRLEGQTDEKTRKYMEAISGASKQMDMLITDLLALSQIGRAEMQKRKINFFALVKGVVREIQDEVPERDIRWEIDELPDVFGDKSLLRLVIMNLLSNAVKFTSTRQQAKIKIGCKDEEDNITCSVRDNGVGFDMKHVDRLFGAFQRLHSRAEFEGTGIGLANVQRIISRHGGRVWAEGVVEQGATFYFTLPMTIEA